MMNKKIMVFICTCSLLLVGCGVNQTSNNKSTTQPDTTASVESSVTPDASEGNTTTSDVPLEGTAIPDDTQASAEGEKTDGGALDKTVNNTVNNSSDKAGITEQRALDIALKHAGVKKSELTSKRIKKDYENGIEVYDVEFYVGEKEYDYEISISDGKILKSDFEIDDDFNGNKNANDNNSNGGKEISINEAKKIALGKVPGAKDIKIKRDIDDGRVVYEGEIYYNNVEYEFEIDAKTGKVISWEEDDD